VLQVCDYGLKKGDRFDAPWRLRTGISAIWKKLEKKHAQDPESLSRLSMKLQGPAVREAEEDGYLCVCINSSSCPPALFLEAVEYCRVLEEKTYSQYDEWLVSHGWEPQHLISFGFLYEATEDAGPAAVQQEIAVDPQEASRWEESVQIRKEARTLKISMGGQSFTDESMRRWCSWFNGRIVKTFGSKDNEMLVAKRVDFSSNNLGDAGFRNLMETLSARNMVSQVLMLHHNQLRDGSAVADYISYCAGEVTELHLSHNLLDTPAAAVLILSAAKLRSSHGPVNRPAFAYPRQAENGTMVPLWLRLEHNYIDYVQLQEEMRPTIKRLKGRGEVLCTATAVRCAAHRCAKSSDQPPAVHVKNLGNAGNQLKGDPPALANETQDSKRQAPSRGNQQNEGDDVKFKWREVTVTKDAVVEQEVNSSQEVVGTAEGPKEADNVAQAQAILNLIRPNSSVESEAVSDEKAEVKIIRLEEITMDCEKVVKDAVNQPDEIAVDGEENFVDMCKKGEDHLRAFIQKHVRTDEDCQRVSECMQALQSAIWGIEECENLEVVPFGSVVSGFGIRGCDVDVVVYDKDKKDCKDLGARAEYELKNMLSKIGQVLSNSGFVLKEEIMAARVPVLKLQYKEQEVDLSINNTAPLLNTRLLRAVASLDKRVVELVVAIKMWTKQKKLCGAVDGHLCSYAFALMVIYFLQVAKSISMPSLQSGANDDSFRDDDSADRVASIVRDRDWKIETPLFLLVCGFFAFYAGLPGPGDELPFEWGSEVVSVRHGRRLTSSDKVFSELRGLQEERLHIEDPFEHSRNLRDVMTKKTERLLHEQIVWMDQQCRAAVFQHGCSPMGSPLTSPDMYPPGILCPAMFIPPWGCPLPMMGMDMLPDPMTIDKSSVYKHGRRKEAYGNGRSKGRSKGGKGKWSS
jgi:DNA polymerase sigma